MTGSTLTFSRATKQQTKLRLALQSPAGGGKTFTMLTLLAELADGEPFGVIDTEHGSSAKYADLFQFEILELAAPYDPENYIAAIEAAEAAGFAAVGIDSMTHEWKRCLELVDLAAARYKGNSYVAWGDVTPRHDAFIERILSSKLHVVATMRSKSEYILEEKNGRTAPRKVGMAAVQRDGVDFEFDVVGEMDLDHTLVITKSRCAQLQNAVVKLPGKPLADELKSWLSDGVAAVELVSYDGMRVAVVPAEEETGALDELLALTDEIDAKRGEASVRPATERAIDTHRGKTGGRIARPWLEQQMERARAAAAQLPQEDDVPFV